MGKEQFNVRTGIKSMWKETRMFGELIGVASRVPRQHRGWRSVRYKRKRYQLFGRPHTEQFICLSIPILKVTHGHP